jgi:hypothetical protein
MNNSNIAHQFKKISLRFLKKTKWENWFLAFFLLISPFLVYYNLELNPRPWHDEGSALSIPRTLVEDGVYASRSSDGYQTFGAVQSVGPTVLIPAAFFYRMLGIGLWQGRVVAAGYALVTLWIFFLVGNRLFGRIPALLAVGFMLGSPAAGYLLYGRQVLGEVPALGFFLAGWLAWSQGVDTGRKFYYPLAGFLLGAAMVTKSQYLLMGIATMGLVAILDFWYYRQGAYKWLILMAVIAVSCVAAWMVWQTNSFGTEVFIENTEKLRQLASATVGFNLTSTVDAIRFLFGSGSGYFYFFWGWPALAYALFLSIRRSRDGLITGFLTIFIYLWLAYFTFLIIPWFRYFLPVGVLVGLFVGKIFYDLAMSISASKSDIEAGLREIRLPNPFLSPRVIILLGTMATLIVLSFGMFYQLQKTVRSDVIDRVGTDENQNPSPPQFYAPQELANFLDENIGKEMVIETWERELGILTGHNYHYPDQVMLAQVHLRLYRGGSNEDYGLAEDYFAEVQPAYLIIGWYSRLNNIYDMTFVDNHSHLIARFGSGDWRYDVLQVDYP